MYSETKRISTAKRLINVALLAAGLGAAGSALSVEFPVERINLDEGGQEITTPPAGDMDQWAMISSNERTLAFSTNAALTDYPGYTREHQVYLKNLDSGEIRHISLGLDGQPANGHCILTDISSDGRFVVFTSFATNLATVHEEALANEMHWNVYLYDAEADQIELISIASYGETTGNDMSGGGKVSDDGRYVVFETMSGNTTAAEPSEYEDPELHFNSMQIVLRDREDGQSSLLTSDPFQQARSASGDSYSPDISADGSKIVFQSVFPFTQEYDDGQPDIFLIGGGSGVSLVSDGGVEGLYQGFYDYEISHFAHTLPQISADGSTVAFETQPVYSELHYRHVVSYDLNSGEARWGAAIGEQEPVQQNTFLVGLSADGSRTAFWTDAAFFDADFAGHQHIFLHDVVRELTSSLSYNRSGTPIEGTVNRGVYQGESAYLTYGSEVETIVNDDTNLVDDLFLVQLPPDYRDLPTPARDHNVDQNEIELEPDYGYPRHR